MCVVSMYKDMCKEVGQLSILQSVQPETSFLDLSSSLISPQKGSHLDNLLVYCRHHREPLHSRSQRTSYTHILHTRYTTTTLRNFASPLLPLVLGSQVAVCHHTHPSCFLYTPHTCFSFLLLLLFLLKLAHKQAHDQQTSPHLHHNSPVNTSN